MVETGWRPAVYSRIGLGSLGDRRGGPPHGRLLSVHVLSLAFVRSVSVATLLWLALAALVYSQQASSRPLTPDDLATLKDIGGGMRGALSISPDRAWVAFQLQEPLLEDNSFRLTWFIVSTDGKGPPRSLGDGGDLILNPSMLYVTPGNRPEVKAVWAPDSRSIFFLKNSRGEIQIWRGSIETGRQEQITRNSADLLDLALSPDSGHLVYSVSRPRGATELELLEEGKRGYLFDDRFRPWAERRPSRRWCGPGWSSAVSLGRECTPDTWVISLDDGRERLVSAHDRRRYRISSPTSTWQGPVTFRQSIASPRGDRVAWLQVDDPRADSAYRPMLRLFAGNSPARPAACVRSRACTGHSYERLWWSDNSEEVYFHRGGLPDRDGYGIYAWQPRLDIVRTVVEGEDLITGCVPAGRFAICLRERATAPREIVSIDLETGAIQSIYNPNPHFNSLSFSRVRTLRWEDDFGNPVSGRLVYPHNYVDGERYPLLVMPYGEPGFLRGDVGDEYPIHVFAAAGFMALNIEKPWLREYSTVNSAQVARVGQRGNRLRRSHLSALENIIACLDAEGIIDPTRIGMTGLSDAAQQVHFAVINSRLIAAASLSSMVMRDSWYYMEVPHVRAHLRDWLGGPPSEDRPVYRELSYRLNVTGINIPLLINVSDRELLLSVQHFVALHDARRPVEMYVFPNEHHIKWRPQHRLNIYRRNLQWFQFWLQDIEEVNPVDPEQYDRWRTLRAQQAALTD